MIQEPKTIDFGAQDGKARATRERDVFVPLFYLDFISIIGKPMQPIMKADAPFFDNITVSFAQWLAPYAAKRTAGIPFNMEGRTFRIAHAGTREIWFLVMHPAANSPEPRNKTTSIGHNTSMTRAHAQQLASYITALFQQPELLGQGVEPSWRPGSGASQQMNTSVWTQFQHHFMTGWAEWAEGFAPGSFWRTHQPAFHAYDYGANIEIQPPPDIQHLPREHWVPQDSEATSSSGEEEEIDEENNEREERYGRAEERAPTSPTWSQGTDDGEPTPARNSSIPRSTLTAT
jgi:hypothetical protein